MRLDFNLICAKHILNMLKIVYIVYIAPSFLQSRYYGSGLFKLNKLYHLLLIFYFFLKCQTLSLHGFIFALDC